MEQLDGPLLGADESCIDGTRERFSLDIGTTDSSGEMAGGVSESDRGALSMKDLILVWFTSRRVEVYYATTSFFLFLLMAQFTLGGVTSAGDPVILSCRNWIWPGWQQCGVNGIDCLTSISSKWLPIRCPGKCTWYDPSLRIWGGHDGVYSGDSRLCVAAIHSGVVPASGGCAKYRRVNVSSKHQFLGTEGAAGLTSYSKHGWFPVGIEFSNVKSSWGCHGFPVQITIAVLMILLLVAVPFQPSLELLMFMTCILGTFYLQMVDMKPRHIPRAAIMSAITQGIYVTMVGSVMLWWARDGVAVLVDPKMELQSWRLNYSAIFIPFWVLGIHLQWLTRIPHLDFNLDASLFGPGQVPAHVGLIVGVFILATVLVLFHLYLAYKSKILCQLVKGYTLLVFCCVAVSWFVLPCFQLHIHHAVVAAVFWPGSSVFKSKLSLACCGLLLGIMLNAIVMWDEDFGIWYASSCSKTEAHGSKENNEEAFLPWYTPGFVNDSDIIGTNSSFSFPYNRVKLYWPAPQALGLENVQSIGLLLNSAVLVFQDSLSSASFQGICGDTFCRFDNPPLIAGANYTFTWLTFGGWGRPNMASRPLKISTFDPDKSA